jgi:hypothetical protein
LTASGIFWEKDEVRRREGEERSGTKDLFPHNTDTSSSPYIYGYTRRRRSGKEETSGRDGILLKERQVDRVGFPTRGDKWKRCNSFQYSAAVCKLLCVNCCMQRRREVSDVEYSQNCR